MLRMGFHVVDLIPQERVLYNKEVQTRDLGEENDATAAQVEAELRERILRERLAEAESAAAREKELDEESVRLEKEIEADIRGNASGVPRTARLMRSTKSRFNG
jgi:predicted Holliday junction resolvase-like endonuclease